MLNRMGWSAEPAIRRAMHFYWRFSRPMTLGVRAVVINGAGEVFLVKHSYVSGWHLPGGGVERGEPVLTALARELEEEGNITLTQTPVLHAIYFNSFASPRDHVALFVVRAFRQDGPPVPDREIIEHRFFPPDALPAGTTAGTRRRLAEILQGEPTAEHW